MHHERLLGLDIGDRRIGVAISDEMGMIASPLTMIPTHTDVLGTLQELIAQYRITRLVVGLPIGLSGREGPQAKRVRDDAAEIADALGITIEFYDERLSTSVAEQSLIAQGTRRDKRKGLIDAAAAAVILQGYLDNARWKKSR